MKECADTFPKVTLTIEAINRYETNLYNTLSQTGSIIGSIHRENVKLLADTFHMNIEEVDMANSLISWANHLSHIHIADSNRFAPGFGHTDFKAIFQALRDIED